MYKNYGKIKGNCPYCGHIIEKVTHAGLCPFCYDICRLAGHEKLRILKNGVPVYACRYYDGRARDAFMRFKFHGYRSYAADFGLDMFSSLINSDCVDFELLRKTTAIAPIPIAEGRRLYRGYNQSALLALEFSKHYDMFFQTDLEPCELLFKKVDFKANSLTGFSRPENDVTDAKELYRKRLVRNAGQFLYFGAFSPCESTHTILIDDIMTTGATLEEATNTLLNNGAKTVICCVYAFSPLSKDKEKELFLDDSAVKEVM